MKTIWQIPFKYLQVKRGDGPGPLSGSGRPSATAQFSSFVQRERISMFPSSQDLVAFRLEFGVESIISRMAIPRLGCCGTQTAVVIAPLETRDATLTHSWKLIRNQADWLLRHTRDLPPTERYCVIVGWSRTVRKLQGQIFRACGDQARMQSIADSTGWRQFEHTIRNNWEKGLFDDPMA